MLQRLALKSFEASRALLFFVFLSFVSQLYLQFQKGSKLYSKLS